MRRVGFISHVVAPPNVDLLNRCFHTKTMFDIKLACEQDAEQILEASREHPSVNHAVSSLIALRENFERCAIASPSATQPVPSQDHGLQQYCLALKGLASSMPRCPGVTGTKVTLLCCQVFISIEQVRDNYAVMAQHIGHALRIMRSSAARPTLDAAGRLLPARCERLPLVDVFIIKLFTAPCGFAQHAIAATDNETAPFPVATSPESQHALRSSYRRIAPDTRTDLMKIAASVLLFLAEVSCLNSTDGAHRLQTQRQTLLAALNSWLVHLGNVSPASTPTIERYIVSAMTRFFHRVLIIIVLSTLNPPPDQDAELQIQNEALREAAAIVDEAVKSYRNRSACSKSL